MLRSSRLFWLVGAVVLLGTGCPGDLKDPQRFPATPLPECAGNIDVVADIFERRCGTDSCHAGDEPAADPLTLDELVAPIR